MGRSAYVLMREGTTGMLIASTQYTLAKNTSSSNHQNKYDNGYDRSNSVGPRTGDAFRGRRQML